MPWEVGSTVLIAKVNMLTKSVPVTVVRCFFLIDGGETFFLPPSWSTSITMFCRSLCLPLLISDGSLLCSRSARGGLDSHNDAGGGEELRSQMLPSSSSSMLPLPICKLLHEAYVLGTHEKFKTPTYPL